MAADFPFTGPDEDEALLVEVIDGTRARAGGGQPGRARPASPAPVRVARAAPEAAPPAARAVAPPATAASEAPALPVGENALSDDAQATLVQWSAAPGEAPAAEAEAHAPAGTVATPVHGGDAPAPEGADGPAAAAASAPDDARVAAGSATPETPGAAAPSTPPDLTAAAASPAPAAPEPAGVAAEASVDVATALMASPAYARLRDVALNPSVSASARSETVVGRREILEYLLDHPEFATHVTRALRLARYRIWRTDDGFFLDDGWGATGQLSLVYAAHGTRVLYARGEFQGKLMPAIPGEALVTIAYDAQPGEDGKDRLSTAVTSQVRIEGAFGELALRLAGASAVEKAEKEARRLVRIVARVIRATEEAPAALYASLRERPGVPERQLEEFRALLRIP